MISFLFTVILILSFILGYMFGYFVFPVWKQRKNPLFPQKEKGVRELNREYLNFMNYDGTKQP